MVVTSQNDTVGFTVENLRALETAIAQGVYTVKYTDKEITYRGLDDMLRIRDLIKKELGLTARGARLFAKHSKGLF